LAEKEEEDVSILCWDTFACSINNTVCNNFKLKQIMKNTEYGAVTELYQ